MSVKRVLIVAPDNLGDAVMATAALRIARRACPGAELGLWVKEYAAGLFADGTLQDRLHAADPFWDSSPGRAKGSLSAFLSCLKEIRRVRYDLALVLNAEWRRSLACLWAGIPQRVGFDRRKSRLFLTRAVRPPSGGVHFTDDHRLLWEAWAGRAFAGGAEFLPRLGVSSEEEAWSAGWLREKGWEGKKLAAAHPFTGDPRKCWPLAKWAELLRTLGNPGTRWLILCGAGEEKKAEEALSGWPAENREVLAGAPLSRVKALLARADLLVAGDSGPGHAAAALGTPVLSLFGGLTDPGRCGPRGAGAVVTLRRDPLENLSVREVAEAAERLLRAEA